MSSNDVMLPIHLGSIPNRLLLLISITFKNVRLDMECGISLEKCSTIWFELARNNWPLKCFLDNLRYLKEEQPNVKFSDIVLKKLLLDMSKNIKDTKLPLEEGITNLNSLLQIFRYSRFGKNKPKLVGIGPCKWLNEISKRKRLGIWWLGRLGSCKVHVKELFLK